MEGPGRWVAPWPTPSPARARASFSPAAPGPPSTRWPREIAGSGGTVETAQVDALDQRAVDEHADAVAAKAGGIDVSFNAIGHGDVHGAPLLEMSFEDFARPITTAMRSQFLTTRAAARHMTRQGSGVVMAITAATARLAIPEVGGTGVTFDAIESQCRQWACELGRHGVRVVWLQTTGLPEALADIDLFPGYGTGSGDGMTRAELIAWMRGSTQLNRLTSLAEVGNAAAFMASDHASRHDRDRRQPHLRPGPGEVTVPMASVTAVASRATASSTGHRPTRRRDRTWHPDGVAPCRGDLHGRHPEARRRSCPCPSAPPARGRPVSGPGWGCWWSWSRSR